MTTAVTVDQLRNLTDRAARGPLTADEQARLRDGIGRLEHSEAALAGVRTLRDRWIKAGPPPLGTSINRWWDKRLVELNAALRSEEQPGPAATQATEAATSPLRDVIAAALYERERPPNDPHWPDAYPMDREVFEPMADAVLAALAPHLNIGEEQPGPV